VVCDIFAGFWFGSSRNFCRAVNFQAGKTLMEQASESIQAESVQISRRTADLVLSTLEGCCLALPRSIKCSPRRDFRDRLPRAVSHPARKNCHASPFSICSAAHF
jgi:hypothetical protein